MPTRDRLPLTISVPGALLALLFALLLIAPGALADSPVVTVEQVVQKRKALTDCETKRDSLKAWLADANAVAGDLLRVLRDLREAELARDVLVASRRYLDEYGATALQNRASLDAAIRHREQVKAKCVVNADAQACAELANLDKNVIPARRKRYEESEELRAYSQVDVANDQKAFDDLGGHAGLQALQDKVLVLKGKLASRFAGILRLEPDMPQAQRARVAEELTDELMRIELEQVQYTKECVRLEAELAQLEQALQRQQAAQPAPRQDANAGGFSDSGDVDVDRSVQAASRPSTGLGLLSGGTPTPPASGGFSDDGGIEVNAAGEVVDQSINRCSQLFTQFSIATGTPFKSDWAGQLLGEACSINCSWCGVGHEVLANARAEAEQTQRHYEAQRQAAEAQRREAVHQRQQRALREQQQQQAILNMFDQTMRSIGRQTTPDPGYRVPPAAPNPPGAGSGVPNNGLLGVTPRRTPLPQQPYRPYQPTPEPVAPQGPGLLGVTPPDTSSIPGRVPMPRPAAPRANAECGEYFSTCE